ncbi:MAG TPA: hypothetical protein VH640_19985 [Bryobacteraceae bacterium]|jgi:hypothetical protein
MKNSFACLGVGLIGLAAISTGKDSVGTIPVGNSFLAALTDSEVENAIALGTRYKSREKLWDREFHRKNDFHSRGRSWEGRLSILTPRAKIAAAAAVAAHELRNFSSTDAHALADLDKITAILTVSDAGLVHHNTTRDVHLVMAVGDQIIQPETKSQPKESWYAVWGQATTYASLNFTFAVPNGVSDVRFIFAGADNKRHYFDVEFSKLR